MSLKGMAKLKRHFLQTGCTLSFKFNLLPNAYFSTQTSKQLFTGFNIPWLVLRFGLLEYTSEMREGREISTKRNIFHVGVKSVVSERSDLHL